MGVGEDGELGFPVRGRYYDSLSFAGWLDVHSAAGSARTEIQVDGAVFDMTDADVNGGRKIGCGYRTGTAAERRCNMWCGLSRCYGY